MPLPDTSENDLRLMGITPEVIRDELQRLGKDVDGDIVGYFLPPDYFNGNNRTRRAKNTVKHDWVPIHTEPPQIVKDEDYNQSFQNFDSEDPIEFTFNHNVQAVSAEEYTQTQRFEISVNAEIPLGEGGALVGFHAAMSSEDVKHKSKTVTETREVSFPLTVPGGEGRLVTEKTLIKSTTTLYESALHAISSAGIEIDPAWYKPNVYWWFYYIDMVFPAAEVTSRIALNSTCTDIDTKVINIPHPGNTTHVNEIENDHFFSTDVADVPVVGSNTWKEKSSIHYCVAISPTKKDKRPDTPSPAFSSSMKVTVKFEKTEPSVRVERRQGLVSTLQALVVINVRPTGNFGAILPTPGLDSASFTFEHSKDISKAELKAAIIKYARSIQWGGQYVISFS